MKIKVHQSVEAEIEIIFPVSFKESEGVFIHCYNENSCIVVFEGSGSISRYGASVAMNKYNPSMNCKKSEVEQAFKNVVNKMMNEVLNPITIDLNSNTPTEELVAIQFKNALLFGHDEG